MQNSWLNDFEIRLDRLESASTGAAAFVDVHALAMAALQCLGSVDEVTVWLVRPTGVEELRPDGQSRVPADDVQERLTAAAEETFVLADATSAAGQQLTVCTRLADHVSCVLQASVEQWNVPQQSCREGATAIVDVVGSWVSRHLMSRYEDLLTAQMELANTIGRLHLSSSVQAAASVMAQDGPACVGRCRIAVLSRQGARYHLEAVTGVRTPNVEAETVRAIEAVVNSVDTTDCDVTTSVWRPLNELQDGSVAGAVAVLRHSDVAAIRICSLAAAADGSADAQSVPQTASGADRDTPPLVISVEVFDNTELPNEQLLRQLCNAAGPILARLQQRQRTLTARIIHSGKLRWLAAAAVLLTVLAVCPADFEVEASGQIVSTDQRRLFAPENGTIDEVKFQNEDTVQAGQLLLQLSNPDLELEHRMVQGNIDTTTARLAAVHASRLSGGDPQLSGEEAQLKQQLQNLKEQQALVEQQLNSLQMTAPFAGTVFRHDSQRELMSRPVQRGQLLLEIVPTDSRWQLEIFIPDDRMSYVTLADHESTEQLPVRYVVRSAPEQDWTTTLTNVDNAVQIHDERMTCRATALLTTLPRTELRPGTTVTARISCGRRSLGFVMFREVLEFWHQTRFAWF